MERREAERNPGTSINEASSRISLCFMRATASGTVMSLITIIQNAADRLSLPRPSAVVLSTDQTVVQLLGLAQQEGKELARAGAWQALTSEKTFITVAQAIQTGALPADFDWIVPDTAFNRTLRRRIAGPLTAEQWQLTLATLVTLVNPAFRIRGGDILITPTPAAGHTVAYEYVAKNWCQSSGGTAQAAWAADSDSAKIDEELHTLGIVWRFKKSKGFDYAEDFATYQIQVKQALNRDGGSPRISTSGASRERVPSAPQTPETLVF
jgi:hypothetical protein